MQRLILFIFSLSLTIFSSNSAFATVADSVGVEVVSGKSFILHKVDAKETLYGISRRYGVTVDELKSANDLTGGLQLGQMLKIPLAVGVVKEQPNSTKASAGKGKHTVQAKETLYGISKKYGVAVEDIKKWNGLTSNGLKLGQILIVANPLGTLTDDTSPLVEKTVEKKVEGQGKKTIHIVKEKETLYSIAKKYSLKVEDIRSWNGLTAEELAMGTQLSLYDAKKVLAIKKEEGKDLEKEVSSKSDLNEKELMQKEEDDDAEEIEPVTFAKITKNGFAEVIAGASDSKKFLAMHRTAPIGTIMQVRNEMNNLSVFVRVIGQLPDTGDNKKILIKVSKAAFNRLGAIDNRFPVEISYVP